MTLREPARPTRQPQSPRGVLKLTSPLQAIVLGLVIQRPSYGYEIANRCQRLCGSFLRMRYTSVYGALGRLQELGLIEALDPMQSRPGPGARRRYRAIAKGGREYRRWMAQEISHETERAELLARIASDGRLGVATIRKVLDEYEHTLAHQARALAELRPLDTSHPASTALCERLVQAERRISVAGLEEWLGVARDEINNFEARHVERRV